MFALLPICGRKLYISTATREEKTTEIVQPSSRIKPCAVQDDEETCGDTVLVELLVSKGKVIIIEVPTAVKQSPIVASKSNVK